MKTSELLEQKYTKSTPEERAEKLKIAKEKPDFWRLQLRKELNDMRKSFGVVMKGAASFDKYNDYVADFGGEYNVLVSGQSSLLTRDDRYDLFLKALAKKIKQIVDKGFRVQFDFGYYRPIDLHLSAHEIHEIILKTKHTIGGIYQKNPKNPIMFRLNFQVIKPK
jgi:hypothetical protein